MMSWFSVNSKRWQIAALVLLFAAIVGPWTFEALAIPSKYDCQAPSVRLRENICGQPRSGINLIFWIIAWTVSITSGLVTGTVDIASRGVEIFRTILFSMGMFVIMLPVFTTLRSLWVTQARTRHGVNILVWGAAAVVGSLWAVVSNTGHYRNLWGSWLYIAIAASALIFELLFLATTRKKPAAG